MSPPVAWFPDPQRPPGPQHPPGPQRALGPDPGDQPERTALAWSRTLLGVAAVCALLARAAWLLDPSGLTLVPALGLLAGAGVVAAARGRRLRRDPVAPPIVAARALVALVLLTGVLAAVLTLRATPG